MGIYCIVYQVSHKRTYQSTGSYIGVFIVLSTRCHTRGPTNLQVLIDGSLVYCLPGVTQKVLPIYRFLYMGFYCIVYQVSQKRSYESTSSYIWVFTVLSTRCHTKGPTNLQVLIYGFLMFCLPGVTQKVLKIYRFLYTGFQCIVYQVSHKRSYQSTGSQIWVFCVLSTGCHTKGPTNLQVLIYGFQCIAYQVSHKMSQKSAGSYIRVFSVMSTMCHKKGPTNLHFLIYGFLLYCLPGVTKKVLRINKFLYMGFYCIVYQVSHKGSYQSTGTYIWVFNVLSTRCHTKGPKNLQVLIYGFLVYCLAGVTQKVLPIYRFLYMGFLCIVYWVSHKRSYQSTGSYIWFSVYCLPGVTQNVPKICRFLYTGFQCIVHHVSQKRSYKSTGSFIRVFTVLLTRCYRKGPTNLQVLIYGFLVYCLPGVTQKVLPIHRFLYTVFSVLPTRCHTKGPTHLQVFKYGFLVYCLQAVTQKVLPIYRFLYMSFYCIVYQVSHKRSYQCTFSDIWVFTVQSTRCHTKGPTNLQVLISGFLVYCLAGVTQKFLPIYRFLYMFFYCIVYHPSHKMSYHLQVLIYGFLVYCLLGVTQKVLSYQSTGSYIWVFSVLSTRCHTKGLKNLQVLIYWLLVYCLKGFTLKVLPIYKFLNAGFYCIAYQVLQKRSYQSTGSYIWVFSVLSARCHTKGPTNLQVFMYSFQCITYQVSHKRSYQSTGSYISVFSVMYSRCHTKGPTHPPVFKYGFLVYCLQAVTQKVLPICRFLYMGFYCIVYQVSLKRSYQSTGSYISFFTVLSTIRHTKCPTNLQVLRHVLLLYCQPGVTKKVLRINKFLYMGFYCIVYQVSNKRSYQSTGSYIRVFSVLSTVCHTKGPSNLQVLIYGFLVYCLPGVTQKVLKIYRFLYTGFQCIV